MNTHRNFLVQFFSIAKHVLKKLFFFFLLKKTTKNPTWPIVNMNFKVRLIMSKSLTKFHLHTIGLEPMIICWSPISKRAITSKHHPLGITCLLSMFFIRPQKHNNNKNLTQFNWVELIWNTPQTIVWFNTNNNGIVILEH